MLEADLLDAVLGVARIYGWRCAHFRAAKTSRGWRTPLQGDAKGWPDLLLVKGARVIAAELKSDTGRLAPEQQRWLDDLAGARVETYVWRPSDLQRIADVLAGVGEFGSPIEPTRRAVSIGSAR